MDSSLDQHHVHAGRAERVNIVPIWIETGLKLSKRSVNARDEAILARLGKRQLLKRNFDFVSMFAFTCLTLASWEGFYEVFFTAALSDGGPGSVIYGFLVIFVGTISTFLSIGELASIAPTAGGQYHWVYMLGPTDSRKILSYLTGWMMVISWQAFVASSMYAAGTILDELLILNYAGYRSRPWQIIFYNWAWITVAIVANTVGSILLPIIECALLLVHILGFIAVFIVLCYITPHGTVEGVFEAVNAGNWPVQGVSTIIGLTSMVFAFLGADAAVHMSEEMHNASINVPKSILVSVLVNGLMGVAVAVPTVFGLVAVDLQDLLANERTYPFISMFREFTGNKDGSTVICALILVLNATSLTCTVTTTSRAIWAFARDKALPFSYYLSRIDKRTSGPLNAVLVTTAISALLSLVTLGSTVVFNSLVSLGVAGFYSTYLASIGLLLWHRIKGNIREPREVVEDGKAVTDVHSGRLAWGPWRIKGWIGTANNLFACLYLLFIMFFSLWPTSNSVDATSLNYSVVVVSAVLICSICYYLLTVKRRYIGPVIEIVL